MFKIIGKIFLQVVKFLNVLNSLALPNGFNLAMSGRTFEVAGYSKAGARVPPFMYTQECKVTCQKDNLQDLFGKLSI